MVTDPLSFLSFQNLDAFEEDLKRLTPQIIAVLRDTVVPFSITDIVSGSDDERPNRVSKEGSSP